MGHRTDVHLVDVIVFLTLVPDYVELLLFRRCHRSIRYHLEWSDIRKRMGNSIIDWSEKRCLVDGELRIGFSRIWVCQEIADWRDDHTLRQTSRLPLEAIRDDYGF